MSEKIVTPNFVVSFPHVFKPTENDDGKEYYDLVMVWDKSEDLSALKKLAKEAIEEKWGEKPPKGLISPFKEGNEKDLEKYPMYKDTIYAAAKTNFQPGLVDQKRQPIIDEDDFYAGCVARASVTAYAWEYTKGKKVMKRGVSFNLNNVQKVEDGERIGGSRAAADDFEEIEVEEVNISDEDDFGIDDL